MDQVSTPASSPSHNSGYMPYLDGLRGLAVLGVLISHFAYNQKWLIASPQWGRLGVDLFFVLSGFLITQILLRYRDNSHHFKDTMMHLKVFYTRRALRIFPIYYLTIFVALLLGFAPIRDFVFWHLTYATNIAIALGVKLPPGGGNHFWSLAIEEQFYLIWPWVVLLTPRQRLRYVIFGFIAVGVLSRMMPFIVPGFSRMEPMVNTRFDVLCMGALLAFYWHEPLAFAKEKNFLAVAGVVVGLPLFILSITNGFTPSVFRIVSPLVEFGVALFFMGVIDRAAQRHPWRIFAPFGWKPFRYVGKISYGIYLYHPFVKLMMVYLLGVLKIPAPPLGLVQLLLYGSATVLFASLSWYLIERPINRLKERVTPAQEKSIVVTPSAEPA